MIYEIFLFLIFLPIVSASSFTGSFIDYGKDTNGDGLFNYLTINVSVNINEVKNYTIYGLLRDKSDNLLEYSNCMSLTPGAYTFSLDFNGRKIYRNQVDGPYNLSKLTLFSMKSCGDIKDVVTEQSLTNVHTTKPYNYTEFQKGKAAIYCNNSPCIASSALINSRDNLTTPEPNAPNTIDGCEDGSSGSYQNDESIESIKITSLNNSFFKIGDAINVEAQVYCDSLHDKLNFVYSNNINTIQWTVKGTKQCSSTGLKTLSATFNLGNNIGQHALRGIFGFNLQPTTLCGEDDPQKDWADTDDIVIYVKECSTDNDCAIVECDHLDGCVGKDYHDYSDIDNKCLADYSCEHRQCSAPIISQNDPRCPQPEEGYQINLTQGWNLISLPKVGNNSINEILNLFNNTPEKIITLKNGIWYIYDTLNPSNSNLNELSESDGFWVKAANNLSVSIKNESAQHVTFSLTEGWNLIGYPSLKSNYVNELFQNVIDDIELIYIYNDEFSSFNPKKPTDFLIKPGTGIFVKVKNNTNWYFDGIYKKGDESFSLNLSNGWNLISIPLISDKTVSELFNSNKLYYMEHNQWKQLENNDKINYSYCYWVKSSESSLLIDGTRINNLDFGISQGWNMINYPLDEEKNPAIFFQKVMDNIDLINSFEDGEWKTFNPLKQNELNSLAVLKPGKGIFIKAKNNAKWNFNGNELVAT